MAAVMAMSSAGYYQPKADDEALTYNGASVESVAGAMKASAKIAGTKAEVVEDTTRSSKVLSLGGGAVGAGPLPKTLGSRIDSAHGPCKADRR